MTATTKMNKPDTQTEQDQTEHRERHWARRLALQALYQWDMSGGNALELLDQFSQKQDIERASPRYFALLVNGVLDNEEELHSQLTPLLDRSMALLDPVERTVLRFACYNCCIAQYVPATVVLSEATRLTRKFGTEKGGQYVNAVLDRLANDLRKGQVA